ncbi:CHASE3 domain-containing protein [Fulvivirga ulvae]|uniref:CHASE3 domain-containing protein n=1 Tax=Fulvivirga ulvae TaxID=2904245 RepID=UPI001F205DD3|nr:CHASE3 domain-containing protein [Fulvivirga ulvae]UII30289.1 CHASE3 domain-containing protein [Fulvivirga ulvae]
MTSIKSLRIIFGIIIVILFALSYLAYRNLNQFMKNAQWVNHTNIALRELEKVISYVKDGENAQRGYHLTQDSTYLTPYYNSKWMALSKVSMIDSLILDDIQKPRVDSLNKLVNRQYAIIEEIIRRDKKEDFNEFGDSLLYSGHKNMAALRALVDRMEDHEWKLLRERTSQQNYSSDIVPLLIFLSLVFAIIAVAYLFSQVYKSLKTRIVTETELERNLMQLSEEVNKKVLVQESLQKVLDNSASAIMFLKALRNDQQEIFDFEIVLSNRSADKGSKNRRLLESYPGVKNTGLLKMYIDVVETGKTKKQEVFYGEDGYNSWFDISAVKLEDGCVTTSTDITERKRDAELIRENQRKFEAIFNQTFQFIGLLDHAGRWLDANQTALAFSKTPKESIIDEYLWEAPLWKQSPESSQLLKNAVKRASGGEFVRYEMEIAGNAHEMLTVDFSLKPIKNDDGEIEMIILEGRDLSELKKAEAERSFTLKLNLIIANSNSFDEAVNRIFQQIAERFDLDYSEIWLPDDTELYMSDIFYARDPELALLHEYSSSMRINGEQGFPAYVMRTHELEYIADINQVSDKRLIRKQQATELNLVSAFGIPVIFNSELVLVSVFFSKKPMKEIQEIISAITQISSSLGALLIRKKTQDEIEKNNIILAAAESMAKMGSWEWNLQHNKVKWSRGVYELHNTTPEELTPTYDTFYQFLYDEDKERVERELSEAVKNKTAYHVEFRVQLENGDVRTHSALATPKIDANGQVESFYGTVQDITRQKEFEHNILLKNEELKKSNENLEQFAYVASHDLQEPLRKIRAFGDRLVTKYTEALDERGRDYISRMQGAAERMQSLIDDLLKYSRVARNIKPFVKIELNAILNEVFSDLEVRIRDRNAEIKVGKLPQIDGDKMQLRQLFQNLISNAIKFTPENRKPLITITAKKVKGSSLNQRFDFNSSPVKHFVEINIKDNGIGFNPKYAERIFNIFERLHGRSEFKGTGIGLAISQKVVQNHKGLIIAKGEEGIGATFTIILPINNNNHG